MSILMENCVLRLSPLVALPLILALSLSGQTVTSRATSKFSNKMSEKKLNHAVLKEVHFSIRDGKVELTDAEPAQTSSGPQITVMPALSYPGR